MLKTLSVLTIRYRRQYIHAPIMDWQTPFDTCIPFLDDYLESTSPKDLAESMRGIDEHQFAELTRQSIMTEDFIVEQLKIQWRELSVSVWECCAALPDLIPYLQECTQVSSLYPNSRSQISKPSNRMTTRTVPLSNP